MNRRILTIAAGAVLLILVGVGLGFAPRTVDDQTCGSPFSSRVDEIRVAELDAPDFDPVSPVSAQCQAKHDDQKVLAFGAIGLGLVALVSLGVVVTVGGGSRASSSDVRRTGLPSDR